jgi:hypothetical protein
MKYYNLLKVRFLINLTFLLLMPAGIQVAYSQCDVPLTVNCAPVPASELIRSSSGNIDFTFDNLGKFVGGITMSGSTILRLKVDPNNINCKWKLVMVIDNNPLAPTPNNEWETMDDYGSSGDIPELDLIEVKVYNGCNTPLSSGIYQQFAALNYSDIVILDDIALNPAGSPCDGTHVNGAGNYITNYDKYSFTIDYRIKPGFTHQPGMYQISIHFCLVEVP